MRLPSEISLAAVVAQADAGDAEARAALFATLYADHRIAEAHIGRRGGLDRRVLTIVVTRNILMT